MALTNLVGHLEKKLQKKGDETMRYLVASLHRSIGKVFPPCFKLLHQPPFLPVPCRMLPIVFAICLGCGPTLHHLDALKDNKNVSFSRHVTVSFSDF